MKTQSNNKIAVILHLYYTKQLSFFLDKLKNLQGYNWDLFVTLVKDDARIVNQIRAFKSSAKIFITGNIGYDVYPFIYVINQINLAEYAYIIKLHTKNLLSDREETLLNGVLTDSATWHNSLVNALLKNRQTLKANISKFQNNKTIGMIGSRLCFVKNKEYYQNLMQKINLSLRKIGLTEVKECRFIAGTMFMARASIFKILQNKFSSEDFETSDKNTKCGTLAHAMERVFGIITQVQGYKIHGVGKLYFLLLKAKNILIRRHISLKGNLSIRLFGILIYHKSLLTKEEKFLLKSKLFDTHWYYKKYLADKRGADFPVKYYLKEGWKTGHNPSADFSGELYLQMYPDVKNENMNPLLHYEKYGKKEERVIISLTHRSHNVLSPSCCQKIYLHRIEVAGDNIILMFLAKNIDLANKNFDEKQKIVMERIVNSSPEQAKILSSDIYYGSVFFKIPLSTAKNLKFELLTSTGQKISVAYNGNPSFGIHELLEKGIYFRISGGALYFQTKYRYIFSVLLSLGYSIKNKILFISALLNRWRPFVVYSENGGGIDNAFELFKYAIKTKGRADSYFICSKTRKQTEADLQIQDKMLVYGSLKHKIFIFLSKLWITSWTIRHEILTKNFKDIHFVALSPKWVFIPHGTIDKRFVLIVHRYFWDNPSLTFANCELEKESYLKYHGFSNVLSLGSPRMDKWFGVKHNTNKIITFFTWRILFNHNNLLIQYYIDTIINAIHATRNAFPEKEILYIFHHEVVKRGLDTRFKNALQDLNINFSYLNETEQFNKEFRKAKYLITDMSSVAYDFAYKKGAIPIYYMPPAFCDGHYKIEPEFFTNNLGVITRNVSELLIALKMEKPTAEMLKRRKEFFKYIDGKNCERVYNAIFVDKNTMERMKI
ncbi:MAG: CDP-glycerol glycerophosphotransferase family protein [Endomicrobium sp.]|jgi:hypothetical protein|nr:CDP-glycerol glycerophosphotransferase family protein [Endomicrobium sp.]